MTFLVLMLADERCPGRSLTEHNKKDTCSQFLRLVELMRLFVTFAVWVIRLKHRCENGRHVGPLSVHLCTKQPLHL